MDNPDGLALHSRGPVNIGLCDGSARWIRGRQHFECNEHANERDVHLPVRQVRASTHAQARSKGKVLRP